MQTLHSHCLPAIPFPAKVTYTKSNKTATKTYKCAVTVKNPGVKLAAAPTVVVNEKVNVVEKIWPASGEMTYTSSDDTIATVDAKGEVTGVKAGKATITATMECGEKTVKKTTEVTVKNYELQSVKQTKANTLEAVIYGSTKDIQRTDITITNSANKNVIAVKSVTVDPTDATKVTMETFVDMADAATYTVSLDGVVKEFVATDGVVADVAVSPLQITANTTGTDIQAQLVDKSGIVISEFKVSGKPANVDFVLATTQGYVSGDKLVLPIVGNKGTAEVTYHTYKYDDKAQEIGAITKKFEIVAVDAAAITVGYNYTIGTGTPDWSKATVNTFSISDAEVNAYFNFVGSDKSDVTNQYSVVSSDTSILLLPTTTLTNNTTGVPLVAVKPGTAYINVLRDNKVVTSLPVIVTDARKLTNITLSTSAVTVSKVAGVSTVDVDVKAFDQTGAETTLTALNVTPLGAAVGQLTGSGNAATKKATITATDATVGSYTVMIEAVKGNDKVARTVSVNVVDTGDVDVDSATDLRLVVSASEIDLAIAADATNTNKDITVSVAAYEKGAKLGNVELTSVKFGNDAVVDATATTSHAIDVRAKNPGTYTIIVVAKSKTFTTNVTIKNTQAAATASVHTTTYGSAVANNTAAPAMLAANVKFYYNGKALGTNGTVTADKITVAADQIRVNGSQVYIGTVKVKVTNDVGTEYDVNAVVNATFTVTQ